MRKHFYHYRIRVKLGDAKRSDPAQEIYASKVIVHEKYETDPKWTNDIALLKLSKEYKNAGNVFGHVLLVSNSLIIRKKNKSGI